MIVVLLTEHIPSKTRDYPFGKFNKILHPRKLITEKRKLNGIF